MGFFKLGKIEKAAPEAAPGKGDKAPLLAAAGGNERDSKTGGGGPSQEKEKEKKTREKKPKADDGGAMGSEAASTSAGGGGAQGGGSSGSGGQQKSASSSGPSVNDFISKTKTQQRKGLKPSGPELIAYARYLGIDPVVDHDLLWIAVEALEAPLPSEWTEHFDSNDRVFYYNATTRISSWTHPLEHLYRETYDIIVNFRNSNLSAGERLDQLSRLQLDCGEMERDVHREIGLWTEHTDEHGHRFYYNAQARQSTWTDPRPAKCHILYLRMKMIRVLEPYCPKGAHQGSFGPERAEGKESRFAPLSPRRDREGSTAGTGASGDTKRPKVDDGGADAQRGSNEIGGDGGEWTRHGANSMAGGAVGNSGDGCCSPNEEIAFINSGGEGEVNEHKHKKKKKKKRELTEANLAAGGGESSGQERKIMQTSQSEPSVGGGNKAAPPSMPVDEARGGFSGPHPSVPSSFSFDAQSESLSTQGRARVKAGIRLMPIGAGGLAPLGAAPGLGALPGLTESASASSLGMQGSSSVPELKPLDKLPGK